MRLADDHIAISLASETIHLRPTLRAAFRLRNAYGDFQQLANRIADYDLTAYTDLFRECGDLETAKSFCAFIADQRLVGMMGICNELLEFVLVLAGAKHGDSDDRASVGKPIPFEEYHERLFGIATGYLGWPPADAWNATPAEILVAHKARQEMLAAIFGGKKADDSVSREEVTPELRARLNALGDTSIMYMDQVP